MGIYVKLGSRSVEENWLQNHVVSAFGDRAAEALPYDELLEVAREIAVEVTADLGVLYDDIECSESDQIEEAIRQWIMEFAKQ